MRHEHTSHYCTIRATIALAALAGSAHAHGPDFNGDGFDDLATGVPSDTVGDQASAGSVSIIYGRSGGLDTPRNQLWHLDCEGIAGSAKPYEFFGQTIVWGDFDGDGFDDLAIGIPNKDVGSIDNAGAVSVLYGSTKGLRANGDQLWHQDVPGINDDPEPYENFGTALASGDFDHDGYSDLAIGVLEDLSASLSREGAVAILYGSASGLKAAGDQLLHQDSPGIVDEAEVEDYFGYALAAGDFDGDGRDDLAVGVPNETIGAESQGAVHIIYGSNDGLNGNGDQLWHQDSPGIPDDPEPGDWFGWPLAAGDFNKDGRADLAIGVPYESFAGEYEGAAHVLYGSSSGLKSAGNQFWHQDKPGIDDQPESDDSFGYSLAVGDFDGDGRDDLAIGVDESFAASYNEEGAVHVLYGANSGLKAGTQQFWHQDQPGVKETCEQGDHFGSSLCAADFDGDGRDDLAVGVRGESVSILDDAVVSNVQVSLFGLTHTYPSDLDIMLVGPNGQSVVLMSDAGGSHDIDVSMAFSDSFPNSLPSGTQISNGPYKPTNIGDGDVFPAPAPAAGGTSLSVFNGISPIGDWSLFISDDFLLADGGSLDNWKIQISTIADQTAGEAIVIDSGGLTGPYPSTISIDSTGHTGAVNVLYGGPSGLDAGGDQIWHRNRPKIKGTCEMGDGFGSSM